MRWIILCSLLFAAPSYAQPTEGDIKKAIFRLTTAYQCGPVMQDFSPYEWAKEDAAKLVGDDKSAEMIAYVEAEGREDSPLNEKFCRNMTKNFHD